ncbi:MAG TPA: twin-arginine translocase subunit TatB [Cycloclasticus sp.]|jgi:sec-independent protein translocase protein TatB|nr:twin-arginine translocase subunit TatB [Cycloclasticus sp.]HIL93059.1 twin-arginine translocase subunit TatB [Cycloclasticus sp.]
MFDIGFLELCLIGVIALLVIGPEKLPRVARTVGLWIGKARGAIKTVKYDIDEQLRLEELRASLDKQASIVESELLKSADKVESSLQDVKKDISDSTEPVEGK